jgi:hypothetical protein
MSGIRLRAWLTGLLAGVFALAALAVPAQHTRMTLERAALELAYAMPDGTLPVLCTGSEEDRLRDTQHAVSPDCLACVLSVAPGLPHAAPPCAVRVGLPVAVDRVAHRAATPIRTAFARRHARAPPAPSIL